ncbi:MAG: hypothetical protein IJ728_14805 [Selenomonadaceae bacterium]|nr:hypothetical protein [Selenomonadaceae bacterium]MBR1730783.1 hypothetical protein [Selenomonadaceae bacterium]
MFNKSFSALSIAPLALIIISVIFLLRNIFVPLVSDDYSYAFIWNADGGGNIAYGISGDFQRVESITDIFVSQYAHYFSWGGRSIAHFLIQFFVWIGKPLFDICNTLIFIALVILICKVINDFKRPLIMIWILLMLWYCVPEWMSTMLWLTGACNYLWMSVLQLLFLLPYVLALRNNFKFNSAFYILHSTLALLAGWSNEAGGFATLFVAVSIMIIMKRQGKLQKWQLISLASFIIGYLLLMIAPGNVERLQIAHKDFQWNFDLLISHLTGTFIDILSSELILFLPIIYYFAVKKFFSFLAGLIFKITKIIDLESQKFSVDEIIILLFTSAGLVVPAIMLFSPEFPLRSCFMSAIFLIIASSAALKLIIDKGLFPQWLTIRNQFIKNICLAIVVIWSLSLIAAIYADISIYRQNERRIEIVKEQSDRELILVPPLNPSKRIEKFLGLRVLGSLAIQFGGDLNRDPKMGQNVLFAKYYGVKSVAVSDEAMK